MKKTLLWASMMIVTGVSQTEAQEKTDSIAEVSIASKSQQLLYKTGKNVVLFTPKDLEKWKGQNLSEVLSQSIGIQITGNFNNLSEPKSLKIRGGKMANVLILLDGVPLKDVTGNDYNASDLRLIPVENIDSIEILNGSSSVLYGSNATVAVINIKTKKTTNQSFQGNFGARAGSFGTFAQQFNMQGKKKLLSYQLGAFNENSEGISAALGNQFERDGSHKQSLQAQVGIDRDQFFVRLSGGLQQQAYDFDNGAFEDGQYAGNDRQTFSGLQAQYQYGKHRLFTNSRVTKTFRNVQNNGSDLYQYSGQHIFSEIYQKSELSEHFAITVGLQYEFQNMGSKSLPWGGTQMLDVLNKKETKTYNWDGFIHAQLQYQAWHLDAGVRRNNHSRYGSNWVYSLNPYYVLEKGEFFTKIGYSYATAFIAPTLYQNYGSLPYVLPNFELKPETNASHEIDFSLSKKNRSLVLNGSLYQRNEKDIFIYLITDYTQYSGAFKNVAQNTVKGFELGILSQLSPILTLSANFSYAERDQATTLRLPRQRANAMLEIHPLKETFLYLSYQYVSKRNDVYYDATAFASKNLVVDAFHLFQLNIQQNIHKNIKTYFNIGNLFNQNYVDVVGFTTRPRNYTLGIDYRF